MALPPLVGHERVKTKLAGAQASGKLPQALLLAGPRGVGKQIDLVADALAEEMTARREQPLYGPPAGLASHPVASVRLLLRRLGLTPAMGNRKVFIVGDAERLIPQLGTEVAANALLKALEEPPADSVIIVTAADPNALLP